MTTRSPIYGQWQILILKSAVISLFRTHDRYRLSRINQPTDSAVDVLVVLSRRISNAVRSLGTALQIMPKIAPRQVAPCL